MWILLLSAYFLMGLIIITCTSAKQEMRKTGDGVIRPYSGFGATPKYSKWKIAAFFLIVYTCAVVAWPLFLRSWFPSQKKFAKTPPVHEPTRGIPMAWLTRKLDDEECTEWRIKFYVRIIKGDELWEFDSPAELWEDLAGSAGIALVREGEVVDSIITRLS